MRHEAAFALFLLLPGCYESITVPERRDAATIADAGPDVVTPSPPDTGPGPARGPCEVGEIVPSYEGPGCSAETLACLEGCAADPTSPPECSDVCVTSDPECVACFNQSIIACSNGASCQAEWNVFACCAETRCPGIGDGIDRLACAAEGACLDELDAYATCSDGGGFAACNMEIQRCFAL